MEEEIVIEVKLSVEVKDKSVLAYLMFRNKYEKSIHLNKQVMYYEGLVLNNYFEIEDSHGTSIDYLGIMSNCTRMPEEFIELQPGEAISSMIALEKFYELTKGRNYKIQYYAFNPSYPQEPRRLMEMQSNKVEISF